MSNNWGCTLDGVTARQLGIMMARSTQRPALPPTVDRLLAIPGRHGVYDFGADLGPRPLPLDCVMVRRDPRSLQLAIDQLGPLLLDTYGRPRTIPLVFDLQPDRTYYVRYSGDLPVDRLVGRGEFALPLIAFDPFAYSIAATSFRIKRGVETQSTLLDGVLTDTEIF